MLRSAHPADPRPPRDRDAWSRAPLVVEGVVVERGGRRILDGFFCTFEPFSRTVILGRSGAGKSTLARLLNRLEDPVQGCIRLGDRDLRSFPVPLLRRRLIGLVAQAARPLPGTVRDNLAYAEVAESGHRPDDRTLSAWLEKVGLPPDILDRPADSLSGGEQQRLAIAATLAAEPAIAVLDEPTAALDPESARELSASLHQLTGTDQARTIAICHQRQHALWLGDQALVIDAGRLVDHGPLTEVLARSDASLWREGGSPTAGSPPS